LAKLRFQSGDVLLLQGDRDRLPEAAAALGCLPLAERGLHFGKGHQAWLAIGIFLAAVGCAAAGLVALPIAFATAVVAVVVAGILPVRDLYEGVDWAVIVLLGAMIPIGGALQSSGTTDLVAEGIVAAAAGVPVALVLALVLVVTMTLSDVLNNAATAVIMAPIGLGVAEQLGVNGDPFLMAVAVGASAAFLTPIGHQNNTLVMGPGGYAFGDYWRMGLPLEIVITVIAVPMILIVWPL
jgi:di/tricarboxylate transporter